ncbi:MAG TPA: M3 family oligoendopeptidase [Candidatus Dojkabacteria bacterium]|nr:M3 family oligoendopeptidase [Candidatus Dojkabacteria bacterium]
MQNNNNHTWNLRPFYKSDNDPQMLKDRESGKKLVEKFVKKYTQDKSYLKESKKMLKALQDYEELIQNNGYLYKEQYYLFLRSSQEADNDELKAKNNSINKLVTELSNLSQFFIYSISKIPAENQKLFLEDKSLSNYKHFLETSFLSSKYLLSEAEEKLLNITGKTSSSNWVEMVNEFIHSESVTFNKHKISFEDILNIATQSHDEKERDRATKQLNKIFTKYIPVATHELNSIIEYSSRIEELKKLERPDKGRHIADDIDSEVVDALVNSVTKRFDLSERYYQLKAKLFGKKKLKYNERNLEYGKITKEYEYHDAKEIVLNVYKKLDSEFYDIAKGIFDKGYVDVFPRKGKDGGAYCMSLSLSLPTYVMLNFKNKLDDVCTIAHEFGHAINAELIKKIETEINNGHSTATAEVASTFFEDFALKEVSKDLDEEGQLSIMMNKLNDDISTIFRQIALYNFEIEIHNLIKEGTYLSTKQLGAIFLKHMKAYMGKSVSYDKGSENWWVYWSHIRNFFYVYSYASGLLISKSMQSKVKDDSKFISKVKNFLSTGTSKSPKEIFKELSIDISDPKFWDQGIKEVEDLLNETENLAKKLSKL